MGFKEITSLDAENTISLGGYNKKLRKENPTEVEGYYLGSRKVTSTKNSQGFSSLHVFQTAEGNLGVWGKTDMDRKLGQVTVGTMTKVEFTGMKATKNNDMYTYKVQVDSDNTIEVKGSDNGPSNYEEVEEGNDTEETASTEVLSAADKQKKVQELLKKGARTIRN